MPAARGDVAFRIIERARRGASGAHVTVVDVNEEMLRVGRARAKKANIQGLDWVASDAERLALPNACADAYTIAFGIRNVTHRDRALAEARRVLRPGGRLMVLEFSSPVVPVLDAIYERFSFSVIRASASSLPGMPTATVISSRASGAFRPRKPSPREISAAGFSRVAFRNLSGGIAAIHSGWAL